MSRAEEITQAALQYANNLDGIELTDEFRRNLCIALGQAFMKGAEWADEHQTDKDLHDSMYKAGYLDGFEIGSEGQFEKGYDQAEKDLSLTWEDIKWIDEHILYVYKKTNLRDEELYEEVLKRFNEEKGKEA